MKPITVSDSASFSEKFLTSISKFTGWFQIFKIIVDLDQKKNSFPDHSIQREK